MARIESYEDLEVWQKGVEVVEAIYRLTVDYPDSERFGLVSQLRRAAVSIPSNIAEGWGRGRGRDFRRFLIMSRGSVYEVKTQLLISMRLGYLDADTHASSRSQLDQVGKMLNGLIKTLD